MRLLTLPFLSGFRLRYSVMRRILVLLTCINLLYGSLYGQSNYALTGVVVNENNQALPGVTTIDIGSGQSKPVIHNGDTTWEYLHRAGEINRSFSSVSWSVGYNYNPGKWSYKANVGKSFRMPITSS